MLRAAVLALVLPLLLVGAAGAQEWVDDLGLGVSAGYMQPMGGDEDYESSGFTMGLMLRKPISENWSVTLDYHHGATDSDEPPSTSEASRFIGWGEADYFKTNWNYAGLFASYGFASDGDFVPYVGFGLGMTMWEVDDWREEASSPGETPDGYDTDGDLGKLRGTNLTASIGAGVEFFISDRAAIDLSGRYSMLLQQDMDNVGFSAANGPDYTDANNAMLEASVAFLYYFGAGDCDEDGIFGSKDKCPKVKEDFDGFEDDDGCPEPDNDLDGILDGDDDCPNDAEDFDGFEDEDGCPDVDRDGDGIMDIDDACPDVPEDFDGYKDEDGCPDPDNDGDGVLDADDECPDTPMGTAVDAVGCARPAPRPELLAVMVNFDLNKATLKDTEKVKVDALIEYLVEDETITVEIGGHASSEGTDEYNQALSERRAVAVRDYMVEMGIDEARVAVVGYGEQAPLVPNDTETNRSANRRAMVTPQYAE